MSHLDTLQQALACFADPARRDAYFDLYDDTIQLHGYGLAPGLASVKAFYATLFDAFPDAAVRVEDAFEAGDKLAVRYTLTGTHRGPFQGVPATGRAITLPGITILRFAGGRCVERWSQADFAGLHRQLTQAS